MSVADEIERELAESALFGVDELRLRMRELVARIRAREQKAIALRSPEPSQDDFLQLLCERCDEPFYTERRFPCATCYDCLKKITDEYRETLIRQSDERRRQLGQREAT